MKDISLLVVLSTILLCTGCGFQQEDEIHGVWGYIRERPDSALTVLNRYSLADFHRQKARAEFALLKSMALDKNFIDLKSDSLIRPAVDYYEKHGSAKEKMLSWFYLGCIQSNAEEYDEAIVSVSRAEHFLPVAGDAFQEGVIHMAKEHIYSHSHNHWEAIDEALMGVRTFESAGEDEQAMRARRKLAMAYFSIQDYAHADSLFLLLTQSGTKDSSFLAKCLLNYAWIQALRGEYSKSLALFDRGMNEFHGSLSYQQAGMYAISQYYAGKPEIGDDIKNRLASIPSAAVAYLSVCYQASLRERDYENALGYRNQLIALEDSVAVRTMEQSIVKAQRDYMQRSSELFRLRSEHQRLLIWGMIALFVLSGILLFVCYRAVRQKQREQVEKMLAAQEEAGKLLKEAGMRNEELHDELLEARRQYVSAYKKRLSKLASLSETYYRTSGSREARELVYREVREIASFISKDTRTYHQLEKNINAGLSGAMEKYRHLYPELKEEEYRFVCYLMAGFPASTISLLTGLSASNIYVRKKRMLESLRKSSIEEKNLFLLVLE